MPLRMTDFLVFTSGITMRFSLITPPVLKLFFFASEADVKLQLKKQNKTKKTPPEK